MNKMKIALVYDLIYPYSIGGAESRYFSLAKHLVLKGHEVHLFGVTMWNGKNTLKVSKKFLIHGISRYSSKYSFKGNRKIFEPIKYSFFLFIELLRYDFDIIDVSAFPYFPVFSCKLYSIIKKKPMVVTWHEVWNEYWNDYWKKFRSRGIIGKTIEKLVAKLSKDNLCVSKSVSNKFKKIAAKKSFVINNWIDVSKIKKAQPLKEKYDIISVGRHLKHKNFGLLLKICSVLIKTHPDLKVLIIGQGPETVNLLKIRQALNLEHNVEILSFTKEQKLMYRYLKSSKIFVLLSELEGFSIISFEAMASGLPVITLNTENNALTDFIGEGKNGYLCNKNEIEIIQTISKLLENEKLLKKISLYSRNFAKKFDIKQIDKIEKYYTKIVKK